MLYSHDAETALIGSAMLNNAVVPDVAAAVRPDDFAITSHRAVWSAIVTLVRRGQAADLVTVSESLEHAGVLEEVGGLAALTDYARTVPNADHAMTYANVVADLAQRRAIAEAVLELEELARSRETPLHEVVSASKARIDACLRAGAESLEIAGAGLGQVIDRLDRRFNGEEQAMGLTTGIGDLDRAIMGLRRGLTVVGARPSMGKTSFLVTIAGAALSRIGPDFQPIPTPVYMGSLEMPADAILERLLANVGNLPIQAIKDPAGHMRDEHWPRLTHAVNLIKDAPLYIDDRPAQTVSHVRARVKEIHERHGRVGLVMIDYLQKMRAEGDYGARHDRAIGEIVEGLNAIGKEFDCPVVLLSQLNRALEQRPNKRPVMADLKESSVIEQEADVILFLYRDEVYDPDTADKGIAEIGVAKNREGEVTIVRVAAHLANARFAALAANRYPDAPPPSEDDNRWG